MKKILALDLGKYLGFLPLAAAPTMAITLILTQVYRTGAYFLDTGWLTYSLCSTWGQNTPGNAAFWGNQSIFALHTFIVPNLACKSVTTLIGNPFLAISILLSFGTLMAGFLGYLICRQFLNKKSAVLCGVLLSFSSFSFGSITYPHPEALGGALAGLGVYGLIRKKNLAWILIILSVLCREDIGIHLGVLGLTAYFLLNQIPNYTRRVFRNISILGFASSFTLVIFQKLFFPASESVFIRTYIGSPPFSVFTDPHLLIMRFSYWIQTNPGLLGFFLLLFITFTITNQRVFIIPVLASIPWVLVNFIAADPAKQVLQLYHTFPFLIYLSILSFPSSESKEPQIKRTLPTLVLLPFAWVAIFGSIAGGVVGSAGSIDVGLRNVKHTYSSYMYIQKYSKNLDTFIKNNSSIYIDSAVASLYPWHETRMFNFSPDLTNVHAILFYPRYSLNGAAVDAFGRTDLPKLSFCSTNSPIILRTDGTVQFNELQALGLKPCR